jgi:FAD/FMN-containing dehydrogenase
VNGLADVVGVEHVITDPGLREGYQTDWTGRFSGECEAVVRPADTAEVAGVLAWARENGRAVHVQGGNTGLVGGSVPSADGRPVVILSTVRLRNPAKVVGHSAIVGAGVTLGEVQRLAADHGLVYGVDLAARDSATIGGTVATNAGGIRVCHYGMTRSQVEGIEAVLVDGTVIRRMGGLAKDNTGFDLAGLLTGSEGTLGVITAVRVKLHDPADESVVAVFGVDTLAEALEHAHAQGPGLQAAEVVDRAAWLAAGGPDLGDHTWALLLESSMETAELPDEALVATEGPDRARLWHFRESQAEVAGQAGVKQKVDVSLPLDKLDEFTTGVWAAHPCSIFGHVADGSLHVELFDLGEDDVLDRVVELGGAVSAEHGVGRVKTRAVVNDRGEATIAAMRALKGAWDPDGVLNPGVVFDAEH